jgi:glycosyltransferase involved in cell wall biosynthesis
MNHNRIKLISIVTPCYNEEENVRNLYQRVKEVFNKLPEYNYEHIFIDNSSTDRTVEILKGIAKEDHNIKIIVNIRNFGHIRSPFYGLLQASGDAVIGLVADLQDPPEMIFDFVKKWEAGYKIVIGIKNKSKENRIIFLIRRIFYKLLSKISDTELIKNFIGFGLYDKKFIDILRNLEDPYPYFRGLIAELGFERIEIPYTQSIRANGKTKNNFYTLYDLAMLGFVNYSKVPLRLASFLGFGVSFVSILIALIYLLYKLIFWNNFQLGVAPLVIGIFFLGGVQLFFLGMIGEYVGAIYTQVKKRPLVLEKERINFDE